jgi:hypothetical protein
MLYERSGMGWWGADLGCVVDQNSWDDMRILPSCRAVRHLHSNSQDLWFSRWVMASGSALGRSLGAPDGCLCDTARPGWIVLNKVMAGRRSTIGDGFTAAGLLLQSELLIGGTRRRCSGMPLLERCASFIEARREPTNTSSWRGQPTPIGVSAG